MNRDRGGNICCAYTPPSLRFDTTFHCALILLFSSYESCGHWWWRAQACPSVEAAAVSAGAEDLLRAGKLRHQPGRGVHSGQKNLTQEFTGSRFPSLQRTQEWGTLSRGSFRRIEGKATRSL